MISLKRICGNTIRNNEECNFNSEFSNIVLIKINLYKSYVFPLLVLVFSLINILTFEQVVILLFSIRQSLMAYWFHRRSKMFCFHQYSMPCPDSLVSSLDDMCWFHQSWFHHSLKCLDLCLVSSRQCENLSVSSHVNMFWFHHQSVYENFLFPFHSIFLINVSVYFLHRISTLTQEPFTTKCCGKVVNLWHQKHSVNRA